MTDISFSEPQMATLQTVPNYNIRSKPKYWLQTLALEAETAITLLSPSEREVYRKSDVWLAVHRNSVWIRKTN